MDSVAGIFFKAIILFFAQPLFWLGLLVAVLNSVLRIKKERKIYRVAIYKNFNEVRNYLVEGLLLGLIISTIVIFLGITVNIEWLWIYPIVVASCFILLGYRFVHPMFTIPISIGVLFLMSYLIKDNSSFSIGKLDLNMNDINTSLVQNSLVVMIVIMIATYFLVKQGLRFLSPNFRKTSRGKWIASYLVKPLTFLPLFLLVPGEQFTALFSWWPVFSIGNETYTLVAIPILIGLRIKIETQPLKLAIKCIQKDLLLVSIVGIAGTILSYYVYYAAEVTLLVVFIGGIVTLVRHNLREKKWHFLYGPVGDGIKIVGIRPDTPATKMKLEIGETIVVCNNQSVKNDDEFYQALLINSAYCHLKIRGIDGEYRLTETAIFADSPHELGIVTIPEKLN